MKNFTGRLIILIGSIINCILFFLIIGAFIYFCFSDTISLENFFAGNSTPMEYTSVALGFIDFVILIVITSICIVDIIHARSMKHALIGSNVFLVFNLFTFLFTLFSPHVDTIFTGLYFGIMVTLIVTSALLVTGSALNFHKDCR